MSKRDPRLFLTDMLEAIEKIERYTAGLSFDQFEANEIVLDAVVRNLEIIGEAARNVPPHVRAHHPGVPWEKMVAIRNVLIHEYSGVSVPTVWRTIKDDLPPLVPVLREVLEGKQDDDFSRAA